MNRRIFLRNGALSGLSVAALSNVSAFSKNNKHQNHPTESNNYLPEDDFSLNEITIDELQIKMKSGELSSHNITQLYLDRIQAIDKSGPNINAVIEVNPDAISIADALDVERKNGKVRGPLHGIPVFIKDNIDTGDMMMTTAGALALVPNIVSQDAFIVKELREAGAVLLGKTNLSEWANFRSSMSTSGWSSRGGQTNNPEVLTRNPCGSSSGSGAAVSANLCTVAIGTETDGSVIAPSSFCGIVGIKPTVGLWSRTGIIPISSTQDTAGPMARTVRDAAYLLSALTGVDSNDTPTLKSKGNTHKDYTVFLNTDSLKGKRIGVEKSFLTGHPDVIALYKSAIDQIKKLGAITVEVELMKAIRPASAGEFKVMLYEFKDGVNKYLSKANAPVKSLAEVIEFNKKNAAKAMPWFGQDTLEASEKVGGLQSKEYIDALAKSTSSREIISDMMATNKLNAIIGTSTGFANLTDLINGDYDTGFNFCTPAAMSGYPHITVPMGKVHELPVGLSFMAEAWHEGDIIGYAYAYEQATQKRESPKFLKG